MVAALALGIGANAGSFVTLNALLLHPFPYPNLDRIVMIWEKQVRLGLQNAGATAADFLDFQKQVTAFEQFAAYRPWTVNLTSAGRPERVQAVQVTPGFFRVFGAEARAGRIFSEKEIESGGDRLAVLSNSFWHSRFASNPNILGKSIALAGKSYSVVGIMSDDFDYPLATDIWVPLIFTPSERVSRDFHDLLLVALLKSGVTRDAANAEMQTVAQRLGQQYPVTNKDWGVTVAPLRQMTEAVTNRFVEALSIAGLFLLLLAAANVANIQLARAMARVKAIAVESALGASRLRLARMLCVESIMVATAGGVISLLTAAWLNDVNKRSIPAMVYRIVPGLRYSRIDGAVVLFTLGLSLLTGILCSAPAIAHLLGKRSLLLPAEVLSHGSRTVAGDRRNRLRTALVTSEIALALLLLVGAGVMANTFQQMLALNLSFNPSNLLSAEVYLPKEDYAENAQVERFLNTTLSEAAGIPNVKKASMQAGMGEAAGFSVEGIRKPLTAELKPDIRIVGSDYFETMQLPMVRGRAIGDADGAASAPAVVISESVAERYFEGADPVGRRIHFDVGTQPPWYTVVGICADTMQWFTDQPEPAIYIAYRQAPAFGLVSRTMRLLLRTAGDPSLAGPALISRVRAADPAEPIYEIKSVQQMFDEERSGVQGAARVMGVNALIALFLAITGIYGVLSYFVSQRVREFGIRIALGAGAKEILRIALREACRIVGLALLIGIPAAYALMRVLSSALYNVLVLKWTTFSALTLLLTASALLAGYIPARRAAKIDPIAALRLD